MVKLTRIAFSFLSALLISELIYARCSAVGDANARCWPVPTSLNGWMPPREEFPRESLEEMHRRLEKELDLYLNDLSLNANEKKRIAGQCLYKTDPNKMNLNLALLRLVTQLGEKCEPIGAIKTIRLEKSGSYRNVIAAGENCLINVDAYDGTGFGKIVIDVALEGAQNKKIVLPYDTKRGVSPSPNPISSLYWDHQFKSQFAEQFCGVGNTRTPSSSTESRKLLNLFVGKNKYYSRGFFKAI